MLAPATAMLPRSALFSDARRHATLLSRHRFIDGVARVASPTRTHHAEQRRRC